MLASALLALLYTLDIISSIGLKECNWLAQDKYGRFSLRNGIAVKIAALLLWQAFPQNYLTFVLFAAPSIYGAIHNFAIHTSRHQL